MRRLWGSVSLFLSPQECEVGDERNDMENEPALLISTSNLPNFPFTHSLAFSTLSSSSISSCKVSMVLLLSGYLVRAASAAASALSMLRPASKIVYAWDDCSSEWTVQRPTVETVKNVWTGLASIAC